MNEYRKLLEDMGQTAHDERDEEIIFEAFPAKYEKMRLTSCEKRDFRLDNIRHMVQAMYGGNLSHPCNSKPITGHSIVMPVTRLNDSDI